MRFNGVALRRDRFILVSGAFDALDLFLFVLEPLSAGFDGHCLDESECGFEVLLLQAGVPRYAEMVLEGGVDHAEVLRSSGGAASDGFLDLALLSFIDVIGARVEALLADGRKDFGGDPALEAFGRFELGAEDQSIEPGLVDAVDGLLAASGVDLDLNAVFFINVRVDSFADVGIT